MKSLLRCSILLLALAPMTLLAQEMPRERFQRGADGRGISGGGGGGGDATTRPWGRGWGWRGGGYGGGFGPNDESGIRYRRGGVLTSDAQPEMPSDEQWREVAAYMQRDLPNTWHHFQTVPEARKEEMKREIYRKFRETHRLREENQIELYDLKMKEAKLADELAGMVVEMRRAPLSDRPAARAKVESKYRQMLTVQFEQREARIARLEEQLAREKERLDQHRQGIDRIVEQRIDDIISRVRRQDDGNSFNRTPQPARASPPPEPADPG